jgi:hypothetical protein
MARAAGGVMNRHNILIASIALAIAAICVGGFFMLFQREPVTEASHSTGEAAYNRFYALERTLAGMGVSVSGNYNLSRVLPFLRPRDTVVIGDDIALIKNDEAGQLVAWVHRGGHLVFSPMKYGVNDVPLMQDLGMFSAAEDAKACVKLWTNVPAGMGYQQKFMSLCGPAIPLRQWFPGVAQVTIKDTRGHLAFASIVEGEGTVSVINDLDAISWDRLKNHPEQQFAWRLLEPNMGRGHIYLFYELIGTSFWANLFLRGWPALLASLLLAIGWMLMRSQRFGPLMPTPPAHRRALLEHIQAVGEFLFRRDGGRSLHRLACEAVIARLRRRDPAGAMLKDAELYDWLAQRSKLEPARIENAFRSPANAAAFRVCITTLARIRSHL